MVDAITPQDIGQQKAETDWEKITPGEALKLGFRDGILGMFPLIIILIILFGGMLYYVITPHSSGSTLTSIGFAKIKPQLAGTWITHLGEFYAVFVNGVGVDIKIKGGKVVDLDNPKFSCVLTPDMFIPQDIKSGENTKVSNKFNCIEKGNPGDVYNAKITLGYEVTIGEISSEHNDTGTIRGPME